MGIAEARDGCRGGISDGRERVADGRSDWEGRPYETVTLIIEGDEVLDVAQVAEVEPLRGTFREAEPLDTVFISSGIVFRAAGDTAAAD